MVSRAPTQASQVSEGRPYSVGEEPKPAAEPLFPRGVQFQPVAIPGKPAREVPNRGPKQNALLESSFEPGLEAADRIQFRSALAAQHEADQHDLMADQYIAQQEAIQRRAEQRAFELQQMRMNYESHIQKLGEMSLDTNRLWSNASTMDKVGATVLAFFGGALLSPGKVMDIVQKRITDDVDAQKFEYEKGLNIAKAKQSTYGLALEQYQNEDAAYQAAMSAGQMAAAQKVASLQAQWKGTEAANDADMLRANLLSGAARSAAAGFSFLQPTIGGNKYRMAIRGQTIPGLVDEKTAQGFTTKYGVEPSERVDEAFVKGGIDSTLQAQKNAGDIQKELIQHRGQNQVVLPNGETVMAPDKEEAGKLREVVTQVKLTQRLTQQAKEIRADATWRASPEKRALLGQIQEGLKTQFGVMNKLGALSKDDLVIAIGGTADLFQVGSGVEARLDRLANEALRGQIDRVATYPGAPPKSSGQMPGSFKAGK